MARNIRFFALVLALGIFAGGILLTGCSRHPNEKQMTALEEAKAGAVAGEDKVAQLEKENAELKAKLAQKQQELKDAQAEKEKIMSQVGK